MLVTCSTCDARLQLDESKAPSQPFKVRCPKCQASIEVNPAAAAASHTSLPPEMTPPEKRVSPFERPPVAPPFKPTAAEKVAPETAPVNASAVVQLLAEALSKTGDHALSIKRRSAWDRRKALVCTGPDVREVVAEGLVTNDYEVFVAENTEEALGRMREDHIEVLVLDANFDPVEQGYAFVTREVKLMRPSERRRLFVVYLTPGVRTMDLHAAFLHNVSLVVNSADAERLPEALEVSLRHYNELYRDFNRALNVPAI